MAPPPPRPRVLFLVQLPPPVHGASRMNQQVYQAIRGSAGFATRLIALNFARDLADLQRVRGGKIARAMLILLQLIYQLLVFRPTAVYFSMVPLNFVLVRDALYLTCIKIFAPRARPVLHFHRSGLGEFCIRWNLRWLYRILFRGCTIIHLSEPLASRELLPLGVKNLTVHAIGNFTGGPPEGMPKEARDPHLLLFLSNLYKEKGYEPLVAAFALLAKEYPQLKLSIAGAAPSEAALLDLRAQVARLRLDNRITIHGGVYGDAKHALLARASILVLPSAREYFPLVILEAMRAETAVIASGRENLGGTFAHGQEILFADDLSAPAIARLIRLLLDDTQLRDTIARGGRRRAEGIGQESLQRIRAILSA